MSPSLRNVALVALTGPAFAQPAVAQSVEELREAFSGAWYVFDDSFGVEGNPCRILFEDVGVAGDDAAPLKAATDNCAGPLEAGITWRFDSGKIVLSSAEGQQIAALGGNPQRLSGDYVNPPNALVLERESGSGAKAVLASAIRKHGCYFLGYTADCAEPSATEVPDLKEETARINVLVELNVRNQPRREAPIIGTVSSGASITVNACLTTSDGAWCRARFGDSMGWMAKSALRQDEWPVITYISAKSAESS